MNKKLVGLFIFLSLLMAVNIIMLVFSITKYSTSSMNKPAIIHEQRETNIKYKPTMSIKTVDFGDTDHLEIIREGIRKIKDITILARIIHAEAKGEAFNGKVAVGHVIMARVNSDKFPDTIKDVVYQEGQFQPVSNGAINDKPSKESVEAAIQAINSDDHGEALFFYNPETATDIWIRTRLVLSVIGNHAFAK